MPVEPVIVRQDDRQGYSSANRTPLKMVAQTAGYVPVTNPPEYAAGQAFCNSDREETSIYGNLTASRRHVWPTWWRKSGDLRVSGDP